MNKIQHFISRLFYSYRGRLLIGIASVGILLNLYDEWNHIHLTQKIVSEREMASITSAGKLLSDEVAENLFAKDTFDLNDILSLAAKQDQVIFIAVTDLNRIIRFSTNTNLINQSCFSEDTLNIFKDYKDFFVKTFPVKKTSGQNIGYLQIGYSLKKAHRELRKALYNDIFLNSALMVLILIIAWLISGILMKPLFEMREASKQIARGNFSVRAHAKSFDIIGELAEALNNMAEQLGDLTNNLNNKIEEKTYQLEQSNKKLLELDKLKSDFVSMVSHELRTPLTSIIGFSRTLLNLKLDDTKREECLKIIESEGKRLANMVEEFLDISKIESGNFSLNLEIFNLYDLIQECATIFQGQSACEINSEISEKIYVNGDKNRLKRVILNLLDNAHKYNPADKPIGISAKVIGDQIVICVQDFGQGIKKEDQENLFEKFYRGKDIISERTRGSGLGLYIAKSIVEVHKGKIWVESEFGKGAKFIFSLPKSA